jgi:hypothetical protein
MSNEIKKFIKTDTNNYKVRFKERKNKQEYPFTGKGEISFLSEDILIHGYLNTWYKPWINGLLFIPIFIVSLLLSGIILFTGIDPGHMNILNILLTFVMVFYIYKIINHKSKLYLSYNKITQVDEAEFSNNVTLSVNNHNTAKFNRISIYFESITTAHNFIETLTNYSKQNIFINNI